MTARLLIDQCVSRRMASAIFAPLADVAYVGDLAQGAPDIDVLALAVREQRILVTEDFDFGRLIFKDGAEPPPGLLHLTLAGMTKAERYAKLAAEAEALIAAAPGRFVVFLERRHAGARAAEAAVGARPFIPGRRARGLHADAFRITDTRRLTARCHRRAGGTLASAP